MLALRDIMTTDVITVAPDTPLAEVAQLMGVEGISGVPVVTTERVIGVVSMSDIMDFSASEIGERSDDGRGGVFDGYRGDVDDSVSSFFTDSGPRGRFADDDEDDGRGDDLWGEFTASDVMTRSLFALPPDTPIAEAGRFMLSRGIHRVLVVDDGRLVGIASSMDFVKVVASGR